MIELAADFLDDLSGAFTSPALRVFPVYLLITFALAAALHRARRIDTPLLAWLVPKAVYLHPSHKVDVKIFLLSRVIGALGVFQIVAIGSVVAAMVASLGPAAGGVSSLHPAITALLLLIVADFSTYWVHRAHHESPIIWPFHALHHSAEVLTPLTLYRKHPLYDLIGAAVRALLIGLLQGGLLVLLGQQPSAMTIAGVNLFYVLFNLAGANLRHTHVWLSYGRVLEHILISPAQHQIHHSRAPQHHNRNYGEVLAIWDWMFGTLYVPREVEAIEYGLADEHGTPLPQRHTTLAAAIVLPFVDSWREVLRLLARRADQPDTTADPALPGEAGLGPNQPTGA